MSNTSRPPLKVSFFLPHLAAGGIERLVLTLLARLDRSLFQPSLILAERRGDLLPQVPPDVEVVDLAGSRMRNAIPGLVANAQRIGTQVLYSGTSAANLVALAAFRFRRSRPSLVVSEHTALHKYLEEAKWKGLRVRAMRFLYPTADCVAVTIPEVGDQLREIMMPREIVTRVLPNPVVDPEAIEVSRSLSPDFWPSGAGPVFVGAGRLVTERGFDLLVDAFASLRNSRPDAQLLILGEGPEREALTLRIRELGLQEVAWLPGFTANLLPTLLRATALVNPARREGFGNVMVEAMACGTPIIAADCPVSPRRILLDGAAGMLVPPEDPAALCAAMSELLNCPLPAATRAKIGQERAREFEVSRTVRAFEELFLSLA